MRHAIYIGRVGALAVALGVGVAAATGYGIGNPAVAWAEEGSQATGDTSDTSDTADKPADDPSDDPADTDAPKLDSDSNTGGAQLSGLDEDTDLDEDSDLDKDSGLDEGGTEQDATTPTPVVDTPQTPTPQTPTPAPIAVIDTAVVTPDAPAPTGSPTAADYVAPADTNGRAPIQDPTGPIGQDSDANAAQFSDAQPTARTLSTLTVDDSAAAPQMFIAAAAAPGTPAPAPLTTQPANLIDALLGAPVVLTNIAITAINTLLTSIFAPAPATPAPPMMLFVVLGWAQRELQRSFSNQSPTAGVDAVTTSEDTGVDIAVLANDTDADVTTPVAGLPAGDVLTVTDYTQPAHGTLVLNPTGTFTYTPTANYTGTDTFTYTVSDEASPWHLHGLSGLFFGGGHTSTTTAKITITPVDDPPVAVNDIAATIAEDSGPTLIDVLANDTDIDAGAKQIIAITQPAHGTATFSGTAVTYTPTANFNGTDTFTYTLNGDSTATATITITPVNDAPVLGQVTSTPGVGNTWVVTVDATDVDGDALTTIITSTDTTIPLTVTQLPGGSFQVVADPAWASAHPGAQVPVTVIVTDTQNASVVISTIGTANNVTAFGENFFGQMDIPALPAGVIYTQASGGDGHTVLLRSDGTAVAVGANWSGQSTIPELPVGVFYTQVSAGTSHTVLLRSDGTAVSTSGQIWTPPAGVTYKQVAAGTGSTVLLRSDGIAEGVGGIPALPAGVTYIQVAGGGGHTVLLRSDGIAVAVGDNSRGQINIPDLPAGITYKQVAAGLVHTVLLRSDGTAVSTNGGIPALPAGVTYTQVAAGGFHTVLLRSDGTVVAGGDNGHQQADIPARPAGVTYTRVDAGNANTMLISSTTAIPFNAHPVATNDTATVAEGAATTITVIANDTDADGTINAATVVITGQPSAGSLTVNPDGTVSYASNGTEVTSDSFKYRVNDVNGATSNEATVSITITPVNDGPVAPNQSLSTPANTGVLFDIFAGVTDVDGGGFGLGGFPQLPANGTVIHPTGPGNIYAYIPNPNFTGQDTFQYRIQSSDGQGSNITVTITVTPNDPPVAVNDTATVGQGNTATIALTANDTDTDGTIDPATIVITQQPTAGTVTVNPNGTVAYASDGTILTPDSFTYTVKDNTGATSNPATVTITIINERPVAADQFISILEDTSVRIDPLAGATDAENDVLEWGRTQFPAVGEIDMEHQDGLWSIIYTPPANYSGQATFYYGLLQGVAGEPNVPYGESNEANIFITVIPVNDAPVTTPDTATVAQGGTTTIALTANDTDIDDTINPATIVITQQPTAGTLTVNPNGTVAYASNGTNVASDSFTYTVRDNAGATSNPATVTITVTPVSPVNTAPVAGNNSYTTNEDTPLVITGAGVLGNDTDVEGNPLTAVKVADPQHGTVTLNTNGSFTYTPAANYFGSDSFTYTASDGTLDSNTATVTIMVNPVNDAPTATSDSYTTNEDTPLVITGAGVLGNDTDVEGNPLTAVKVSDPAHGTVTLNADGSFTYTPALNYNGQDSFTYKVRDGALHSNVATVTVTVNPVNDAPAGTNDSYTLAEDTTLTIPAPGLLANDFDAEGPLFISNRTSVSHGTIEVLSNGAFTYTPTANYNGTDSFTYRVSDSFVTSSPITVNFTITPVEDVNDAPVSNPDAYSVAEDGTLSIPAPGLLSNDTDANGQQLFITDAIAPSHGTLGINPDGSFTYTPSLNYNGPDSFSYQVSDSIDKSAPTTVNITVTPVNDAPVINNDTIPFPKNGFIGFSLQNRSSDVDGDALKAILISGTQNGTLFFDGDQRVFTYKPNTDFVGQDSFTYKVNDGLLDSAIATVTLNVS